MEMSNYRAKSTKVTKIEETERRLKSDQKNYLKEHGNKNLLQMT